MADCVRLVWADEQIKWLHNHVAQIEGYRRSTPYDAWRDQFAYEAQVLGQVQHHIRTGRWVRKEIVIWEWWAYWYSASQFATRIAPWGPYAAQMEESDQFQKQLLRQRSADLAALRPHEKYIV